MSFWQNILLGFTLSAPIGPVNISALKHGLKHGFWPALFIGLGAITVDAVYMTLVYFGLGHFLIHPLIQNLILFFGAIVLIFLGIRGMREGFCLNLSVLAAPKRKAAYFKEGALISITSPMTVIWWIGVFGAVMSSSIHTPTPTTYINAWGILVGCIIWAIVFAALTHLSKRFFNEFSCKIITFLAGLGLIGFGLYFLWQLLNI